MLMDFPNVNNILSLRVRRIQNIRRQSKSQQKNKISLIESNLPAAKATGMRSFLFVQYCLLKTL